MTSDLKLSMDSRVSVITPFLNAERFLAEAIESVLAQSYSAWELLLIDDGSTDRSTEIARRYAEQHPEKIRYLCHPGGENRGASATRNVGLAHARGEYIALLDADDVYLPHKLEDQVRLLDAKPEVGMVCGRALVWYSWAGRSSRTQRDYLLPLGFPPDTLVPPPMLLARLLHARAHTPCPCSVLIRRSAIAQAGTFEEEFRRVFTDQVFFAKLFLSTPIFIADGCWDKYRQHPRSSVAQADRTGEALTAELAYLAWLESYLSDKGMQGNEAWEALHSYIWWRHRRPLLFRLRNVGRRGTRALKTGLRWIVRRTSPRSPPRWLGAEWQV